MLLVHLPLDIILYITDFLVVHPFVNKQFLVAFYSIDFSSLKTRYNSYIDLVKFGSCKQVQYAMKHFEMPIHRLYTEASKRGFGYILRMCNWGRYKPYMFCELAVKCGIIIPNTELSWHHLVNIAIENNQIHVLQFALETNKIQASEHIAFKAALAGNWNVFRQYTIHPWDDDLLTCALQGKNEKIINTCLAKCHVANWGLIAEHASYSSNISFIQQCIQKAGESQMNWGVFIYRSIPHQFFNLVGLVPNDYRLNWDHLFNRAMEIQCENICLYILKHYTITSIQTIDFTFSKSVFYQCTSKINHWEEVLDKAIKQDCSFIIDYCIATMHIEWEKILRQCATHGNLRMTRYCIEKVLGVGCYDMAIKKAISEGCNQVAYYLINLSENHSWGMYAIESVLFENYEMFRFCVSKAKKNHWGDYVMYAPSYCKL